MTKSTYDLIEVQYEVKTLQAAAFTASALNSGQNELGLTLAEMIATVGSASVRNFYKTMPSQSIQGAYQDVYHLMTPLANVAYTKFCLHPESKIVVSFKRK
jgi:hypothetical protein